MLSPLTSTSPSLSLRFIQLHGAKERKAHHPKL